MLYDRLACFGILMVHAKRISFTLTFVRCKTVMHNKTNELDHLFRSLLDFFDPQEWIYMNHDHDMGYDHSLELN